MTPMQLSGNGYFYLDHFTIRIQNGVEDLLEALNLATEDGSSCALTISGCLDVELITETAEGRTLRFSTSLSSQLDAEYILEQSDFPLRELSLPNRLLVKLAGQFELPRLEVIIVVCAESIRAPNALTIAAPLVRRVEFVAGTNDHGVTCCYPGTPKTRDAFIRRCFQLEHTHALDVRADPADRPAPSGDVLDGPEGAPVSEDVPDEPADAERIRQGIADTIAILPPEELHHMIRFMSFSLMTSGPLHPNR